MPNRTVVMSVLAVGALGPSILCGQVRRDAQLWSEVDLSGSLTPKLSLTLLAVDRTSMQLKNPQLGGVGLLADWRATSFAIVSAGYIYAGIPNTGPGYTVHVPLAAVTLARGLGRWSFKERSRGERLYRLPGQPWRYRQKVEIGYQVYSRVRIFVNDEAFFDFVQARWNQNRAQAGFGLSLNRAVALDLYYLQRNTISAPTSTKAAGLTLRISLGSLRAQRNSVFTQKGKLPLIRPSRCMWRD